VLIPLVVGTILIIRPWSGNEVPAASEYSSAADLARDLNEHGLGCDNPTRPPALKAFYGYLAIFIDRRLLPETLACSVDGQPVILGIIPQAWFSAAPTPRYTNFEDAASAANDGLETMLVGPNWMVMPRQRYGSIPALSAIREELGGTLVVASPTPTSSPSTSVTALGRRARTRPRHRA
jgi:hypothetical protein